MGNIERSLSLDADLVRRADAAGVDLQGEVEAVLRRKLAQIEGGAVARADQWRKENAEALAARRARIENHGVFGEDLRRW